MKISVPKDKNLNSSVSYRELKKVADILEASKYLDDKVIQFRKNHSLPQAGYSFDLKYSEKIKQAVLEKGIIPLFESYKVLSHFDLPLSWVGSIMDVFIYNTLSYPDIDKFSLLPMSEIGTEDDCLSEKSWAISLSDFQGHMEVLYLKQSTLISINEKCTKSDLKKYIDDNWKQIKSSMKNMREVQQHSFQRIDLAKKITNLRDKEKMKFSGIAKLLAKQYEDCIEIYELLTEDYVKNLYTRWKKKQKSIDK